MSKAWPTIDERPALIAWSWGWLGMAAILFFPVFVDLLNGFLILANKSSFSVGILYRGALFVATLPFLLMIKQKWLVVQMLILVFLFLIGFLVWSASGLIGPQQDILVMIKICYPFTLLAYMFFIGSRKKITANQLINLFMGFCTIAAVAVLFSLATGIGISPYGDEKTSYTYGTKSFFSAQNDIGITLLIGYVFSMYRTLRNIRLYNFLVTLLIAGALVALSTRTGIIGAILVTIAFSTAFIQTPIADLKLRMPFRLMIMVVGAVVIAFVVYELIHLISQYDFLFNKFRLLISESPRQNLQRAGFKVFEKRPWYQQIFGQGAFGFTQSMRPFMTGARAFKENGKTIEVDYLDLFGNYGLLFTAAYFVLPLTSYAKCTLKVFKERSLLNLSVFFALTILLCHSALAGHVFFIPMVASPLALLYFLSFTNLDNKPLENPSHK